MEILKIEGKKVYVRLNDGKRIWVDKDVLMSCIAQDAKTPACQSENIKSDAKLTKE